VTYDEGLRSYKAIAFIAISNQNPISTVPFSYLKLGATLPKTVLTKQKTVRYVSKNLGEKNLWIK
jgi:hypothetical protein